MVSGIMWATATIMEHNESRTNRVFKMSYLHWLLCSIMEICGLIVILKSDSPAHI